MVQNSSARLPANRSSRALERKRQILHGASRVFRRRGLHGAGMREIAAELDMHVGNLYYYFRNKEELLAFCQQDALAGLARLARGVRGTKLPADAKLKRLMIGHVVRLNEETPGSLAHLEVEAVGLGWRSAIQRQRDDYEAVYRDLVSEGTRNGLFRAVDPKVASMAILGALNWTVKWYREEGGQASSEIGEQIADLLLRGLRREPERRDEEEIDA